MKKCMLFIVLLLIFFLAFQEVEGMFSRKYIIEVHGDRSVTWIIEHRFLIETEEDQILFFKYSNLTYFSDFQRNVRQLLDLAKNVTGRDDMDVENFEMNVNFFDSYKIVTYKFDWINFSEEYEGQIKMKDVFQVQELFLLGDGRLDIVFPSEYVVKEAYPKPNVLDEHTLTWYAVKDVEMADLTVIFEKETGSILDVLVENLPVFLGVVVFFGGVSILWFFFKFRRKKEEVAYGKVIVAEIEDDEDRVIDFLKKAGGYMYQSTLADQCGFSRSKISKLLKAMEEKGIVRRYKKGREKMVALSRVRIKGFQNSGRLKN